MKYLALLLLLISQSSCSLLFDAADISNRRSNEIAEGATVAGDGFTVHSPESGLYSASRDTRPGGITLRPTEPFFDGLVYFVAPFEARRETNLHEVLTKWNSIPEAKGYKLTVLRKTLTSFDDLPALQAVVEASNGTASQVTSILIIKRSADYLILSTGHPYHRPTSRQERQDFTNTRLNKLQAATKINRG